MTEFSVVGRPAPRIDSMAQTSGRTQYADDIALPGQLVGKLLRSTHAHAAITRIDTSKAEALEGVRAVITGDELPIRYGILPVSQDETALAVDKVRYIGEPVVALAAVDADIAESALSLIRVEYEPLGAVMTMEAALDPGSPVLHVEHKTGNVHRAVSLEFGDMAEGFGVADVVREDVFFFGGNNHAALEQHSAVGSFGPDGRLTLWASTQVPHYLHRTLEKVLEMPAARIRVVATPSGGGFGAKSDVFSHEIVAAKLSEITGRPVKITLTREEVFYAHRGRHPVQMRIKTGFAADGEITAMHFQSFVDGGAYGGYGVASLYYTGALQPTTYRIPNYQFDGVRVFTNKPPCGPKRGHGTPQPRYGLECHLDRAAADLGLDPVDLRRRNAVQPFSTTVNHLPITSCGLEECMDEVVAASGYDDKAGRLPYGRGVGFAIGSYLTGAGLPIYRNEMPQSEVQIKVDRGGGVTIYSMAADIGQGSTSILAILVGEILGLEPTELSLVTADTDLTPVDLGSYSSRVTYMAGNAAVEAAEKIKDIVFGAAAGDLDAHTEDLMAAQGRISVRGEPAQGMPWAEAVRVATAHHGPLVAAGSYKTPPHEASFRGAGVGYSPAYSYSACVVELDCDPGTGEIKVDKVWMAHDVGRALNPLLVEGQVEGSVYMALGEALMEEQAFRGTLHHGPSLLDYKLPTFFEMPDVETILIETDDPGGPFGAKEAGQGPLLPVIPAVANALHDAIGVRIDEVPITPDKVVRALRSVARGGSGRIGPGPVPDFAFPDAERVEPPADFEAVAP